MKGYNSYKYMDKTAGCVEILKMLKIHGRSILVILDKFESM